MRRKYSTAWLFQNLTHAAHSHLRRQVLLNHMASLPVHYPSTHPPPPSVDPAHLQHAREAPLLVVGGRACVQRAGDVGGAAVELAAAARGGGVLRGKELWA